MKPRRGSARRPSTKRELSVGGFARFDLERAARTGAPEVILAEGKTFQQLLGLLRALRASRRGAIVSRASLVQRRAILAGGLHVRAVRGSGVLVLPGPLGTHPRQRTVALLSAGTSDHTVAEEIRAVLRASGVSVATAYDVGVAGLHRLLRALERIRPRHPALYLVCAGREGALPTVVAGLVRAPVVGVPTSSGYGRGGRGEAALAAMLQSCAPIAVVNIDGGVPAALFALQLLAAAEGGAPRRGRGTA